MAGTEFLSAAGGFAKGFARGRKRKMESEAATLKEERISNDRTDKAIASINAQIKGLSPNRQDDILESLSKSTKNPTVKAYVNDLLTHSQEDRVGIQVAMKKLEEARFNNDPDEVDLQLGILGGAMGEDSAGFKNIKYAGAAGVYAELQKILELKTEIAFDPDRSATPEEAKLLATEETKLRRLGKLSKKGDNFFIDYIDDSKEFSAKLRKHKGISGGGRSGSPSKLEDERAFARAIVAKEKDISENEVNPVDTFEKVKELRRAGPEEAGAVTTAKEDARRVSGLKKTYPKQASRNRRLNREWKRLDSVIDRAISKVDPSTTGVGSLLTFIRGGEARDLENLLSTIKANRGFSNLAAMRADSPTGGALGQVSELENLLLQAIDGSLDQSQSASQLKENLEGIKEILDDMRLETEDSFQLEYGEVIPGRKKIAVKGPVGRGDRQTSGGNRFVIEETP